VAEPFLGEIRLFPFNFAPRGWAFCAGQTLPIAQNTALFALIGTFYGGDGIHTFVLPDLRGRVAVSAGQGPGLSPYNVGQAGGTENVTLNVNQMPAHTHTVAANDAAATATRPAGGVPARTAASAYAAAPDGTLMSSAMIGAAGGGQPVPILEPYLALNYCIALQGIFPSRN
jgi:microcystin-dependent protein